MRHHHAFIEGIFKFAFGKVFVDYAEWRSLFERAVAGTQRMTTTAIDLRQRLSVGKVIGQNRRSREDNAENCRALRIAPLTPDGRIVQREISTHGYRMVPPLCSNKRLDGTA